jgi:uncharacterized membrane protein
MLGWVGVLAVFACVATVWNYAHGPLRGWRRFAGAVLKLFGFALLLACLLEPQWVSYAPKEKANIVALLLDDSKSMRLPDAGPGRTRGQRLMEVWKEGAVTWRSAIEKDFRTRAFQFAGVLREHGKNSEPSFEGSPSLLGGALRQLPDRIAESPCAVVVFSDGVAPDLADLDPTALPPVYPVVFGPRVQEKDLGIGTVTVTQAAFEDAPVTLGVEVRGSGFTRPLKARVRVEAVDPAVPQGADPVLARSEIDVQPAPGRSTVQLQFTPLRSGPTFYVVRLDSPELPIEAELTAENNSRQLCVNRARGPHPLLYVAGRPNWEFGVMRRALEGDPELQLQALIRIAKREPKFTFKGRGGENTNPLFRGFQKGEDAELQRYDQPVIVRINVDSAEDLKAGFPKTVEELFAFKGLIVDDIEAEFFSSDQLRMIQRFVGERGGGLLMLGGMESFEGGGWRDTPLETLLPVWIGKESAAAGAAQWALSREGLLEPWIRRRKTEAEETVRMSSLPPLEVVNGVAGIKPAATVLAWARAEGGQKPALVTQRYGLGRSAALLAGDLFRWGIGEAVHGQDLAKTWRQIARWLVADVPNAVDVNAVWSASTQATRLQIRVRDAQARPVEDASVQVRLRRVGEAEAATIQMRAEAVPEPGVYVLEHSGTSQGAFIAEVSAFQSDGTLAGTGITGWVQDNEETEFQNSLPDFAAMEALAKRTGGEVLAVEDLGKLSSRLRNMPGLATELRVRPLWHNGGAFVLAILCFSAEWLLRRRGGAA